jgi:hypothetical protein
MQGGTPPRTVLPFGNDGPVTEATSKEEVAMRVNRDNAGDRWLSSMLPVRTLPESAAENSVIDHSLMAS